MLKPQTFGCMFALVAIISFTLLINVTASVSSICPDDSEYGANNCSCDQDKNRLIFICSEFQANQTMTFARPYNFSSIVLRDLENVDVLLKHRCLDSSQNCLTTKRLVLYQLQKNAKQLDQLDQLLKFPTDELSVQSDWEIKHTINLRNLKPSIKKIELIEVQQPSIPFGPNHGFLESFPQLNYMRFKDVNFVEDERTNLTITELSPKYIVFDNTNLKGTFSFTPKTCDPHKRIYIKLNRNKDLTHFNFESLYKGTNVTQCKYHINLLEGNFVPNFLHDHVQTLEKYKEKLQIRVDKIIECNCKLWKFNQRNALAEDYNFCNNSQTFLNQSQNGDNKEPCQE